MKKDRPGQEAVDKNISVDKDDLKIESVDIKNAHASGTGSLERSDENEVEKLNNGNKENDAATY